MTRMSMKVHPSHTDDVSAARSAHAASQRAVKTSAKADSQTRSFAALLASQSSTTTTTPGTDVTTTTTTAAAKTTAERHPDIKLLKGETMTHVKGHSYAEIDGGRRDGMFVNTTHNKRRGMAFVRVERNGREYHIYGSGKNRLVVACKPHRHATTPTTSTDAATGTGGATPTVSKT
jgi:hypothetical protein